MSRLEQLLKMMETATTVGQLTHESKAYNFAVTPPVTFYLDAENAAVTLRRGPESPEPHAQITVRARLQVGFGWRVVAEQDEAGVYLVARRRPLVGGLARARLEIFVPSFTYVMLKLQQSALLLDNLSGEFHLPAATFGHQPEVMKLPQGK